MADPTPAPAPAANAPVNTAPAAANTTAATDWTSGLTPELKGVVELKGWKDPASLVDSYRNLEKLTGDPSSLVKLPGKDAKPEDWAPVYEKLGRPKDPAGYEIKAPDGGDPKMAEWAANAFHKHGLSKAQAQALLADWNGMATESQKAQEMARSSANEIENGKLKLEWGAAFDKQIEVAKRAAVGLGVDAATIDALEASMGFAKTMKFFNALGSKMGEAEFVGGDGKGAFNGTMTPGAAQARMAELRADKGWGSKFLAGDVAARGEWERLHKLAYPEN